MKSSLESRPLVIFEVEKVIGISSDGSYQVQWAPAWVSKFHLVGCEHLIHEFLQQQSEKENESTNELNNVTLLQQGITEDKQDNGSILFPSDQQPSSSLPLVDDSGTEETIHIFQNNFRESSSRDEPATKSSTFSMNDNSGEHLFLGSMGCFEDGSDKASIENHEIGKSLISNPDIAVKNEEDEDISNVVDEYTLHSNRGQLASNTKIADNTVVCSYLNPYPEAVHHSAPNELNNVMESHTHQKTGKHGVRKRHVCSHCEKSFIRSTDLTKHIRTHNGEKPFECTYCKKRFSERGNLNKHVHIHTGLRPHKCNACDKSFAQKVGLKNHLRQHICKNDNYFLS